ncbi:SGNH/GDSL hydrolase family protein [Cytophagaceae bacterium DM2B3-1]|uniref:SGNH/GDSL hydrolase family protein n=1 Tax=Xanthocytophaga flava TaxID=3048013 RepID=A0ABT7CU41_9BACT|nr:SGNH/GDSL hydrolase family protein [Xanthocytophaga flavus]MDJ1469159.1 SGNH/GDSL hydrolase family protein [Xanthocytophaga flavus]MDJ1497295.1 SGNH/GDSL hydrolase family protein [Xanthocytophaga flavus]
MSLTNLFNRRNFLKKATAGTALSLSIPQIVSAAFAAEKVGKITLQKDDVILFQGDSITDAGRKREVLEANNTGALGSGYAFMAASDLLLQHADKTLKIYNKGISGNKVYQLAERWDADCLDLKPNVLSILIGVNDFWHTLTHNYTGTVQTYQADLKTLLDRTKQKYPTIKLVIGEPFAVTGIKAVDEKWYPAFNDYRKASREIADSYGAVYIPYQTVFDKAQKAAPGVYWTYDGVHPSIAGARLMAQAWLEAVKG